MYGEIQTVINTEVHEYVQIYTRASEFLRNSQTAVYSYTYKRGLKAAETNDTWRRRNKSIFCDVARFWPYPVSSIWCIWWLGLLSPPKNLPPLSAHPKIAHSPKGITTPIQRLVTLSTYRRYINQFIYLLHGYLNPPEPTCHTATRSVQPISHNILMLRTDRQTDTRTTP